MAPPAQQYMAVAAPSDVDMRVVGAAVPCRTRSNPPIYFRPVGRPPGVDSLEEAQREVRYRHAIADGVTVS